LLHGGGWTDTERLDARYLNTGGVRLMEADGWRVVNIARVLHPPWGCSL
jgi:hypothetical protein